MKIRLKELRLARKPKLTQEELAAALGCAKSHVSEMESGKRNPSHPMLERIAAFFGVSLPELYEIDDDHARRLRDLTAMTDGLSEEDFEILLTTAGAMRARSSRGPA